MPVRSRGPRRECERKAGEDTAAHCTLLKCLSWVSLILQASHCRAIRSWLGSQQCPLSVEKNLRQLWPGHLVPILIWMKRDIHEKYSWLLAPSLSPSPQWEPRWLMWLLSLELFRTRLSAESVPSGLFPLCGKPSRGGLQLWEVSLFQGVLAHSFSLHTYVIVSRHFLSIIKLVFWSLLHQSPRSFLEIYSEFKWGQGMISIGPCRTPTGVLVSSLCQLCDYHRHRSPS